MTRFLAGYPEDLAEWEGDERLVSRGFTHPWRSEVAAANGEAFFDALARDSLLATVRDVRNVEFVLGEPVPDLGSPTVR